MVRCWEKWGEWDEISNHVLDHYLELDELVAISRD